MGVSRLFATTVAMAALMPVAGEAADIVPGQPVSAQVSPPPADGWLVTLKGSLEAGPRWLGADTYRMYPFPGISIRRAGTTAGFSAPDDGIGIALFDNQMFRIGPVARLQFERKARGELAGLRHIDWAIEPGIFAEFWPAQWFRTRIEVRRGFNGHRGIVADLAADWVQQAGAFTTAIGPRIGFGNSRFTNTYFGVTPLEALANGSVTPYRASGGVHYAGLAGSIAYRWTPALSTTVYGSYQRLVGDAARSPIVRNLGSRDQFTVGLSVSYTFALGQ